MNDCGRQRTKTCRSAAVGHLLGSVSLHPEGRPAVDPQECRKRADIKRISSSALFAVLQVRVRVVARRRFYAAGLAERRDAVAQLVADFERYAATVQEPSEQVEPRDDQDDFAAGDIVVFVGDVTLTCDGCNGAIAINFQATTVTDFHSAIALRR
jgi:hypothetical protein